jgi:hypothetical protein
MWITPRKTPVEIFGSFPAVTQCGRELRRIRGFSAVPKRLTKQRPTYAEIGAVLGITKQAVGKLHKQRGMPVDGIESAVAWHAKNVNPRKEKPPVGSIGDETARLKSAQADIAEIDAARMRGELIEAEEVRLVFAAAAVVFASQMQGLPGRVANELAALDDPALITHKLRDEIRRIREAVSQEFGRLAVLAASRPDGPAS